MYANDGILYVSARGGVALPGRSTEIATFQEFFLVIPADGQFPFAGQHPLLGKELDGIDVDCIGAVDADQPVEGQPVE
jgi:hypothetical protein